MCKQYNGWDNFETWKLSLEMMNEVQLTEMFEILGYSEGDEMPETYEVSLRLKDYVLGYVEEASGDAMVKDWARVALEAVNYYEIAQHMTADIAEEGFFSAVVEEEAV